MSWRALFATFLLALAASGWGGIQLGDWLATQAPAASSPTFSPELALTLDARGMPLVVQPPQPRIDGTLGVPDPALAIDWHVSRISPASRGRAPMTSVLPAAMLTQEEAWRLMAGTQAASTSNTGNTGNTGNKGNEGAPPTRLAVAADVVPQAALEGLDMAPVPAAPARSSRTAPGWSDALERALAKCAQLDFSERPMCAWSARSKYCDANRGSGTVAECRRAAD